MWGAPVIGISGLLSVYRIIAIEKKSFVFQKRGIIYK